MPGDGRTGRAGRTGPSRRPIRPDTRSAIHRLGAPHVPARQGVRARFRPGDDLALPAEQRFQGLPGGGGFPRTAAHLRVRQRGVQRPQGGICDLGAVEYTTAAPPPSPPETPPPTQPPYACVELLGVTVRNDGTMRIQLETQDLPEGEYEAQVGKYEFTCKTYRDYPDRLFCDGPKGKGGTLTTLTIFDASGAVFCEETFTIPEPEKPETKEPKEPGEEVDCSKYGSDKPSCEADSACKWLDSPEFKCVNK